MAEGSARSMASTVNETETEIEMTTLPESIETTYDTPTTRQYMDMSEHLRRYYNLAPRMGPPLREGSDRRRNRRPHEQSARLQMPEPFYHSVIRPDDGRPLPALPAIYREAGAIPGYDFWGMDGENDLTRSKCGGRYLMIVQVLLIVLLLGMSTTTMLLLLGIHGQVQDIDQRHNVSEGTGVNMTALTGQINRMHLNINYQFAKIERTLDDANMLERMTHDQIKDEANEVLDQYRELRQMLNSIEEMSKREATAISQMAFALNYVRNSTVLPLR